MTSVKREDAGRVLSDTVRSYMSDLSIDNGLKAVGFTTGDIPALVKGTLPQVCLISCQEPDILESYPEPYIISLQMMLAKNRKKHTKTNFICLMCAAFIICK